MTVEGELHALADRLGTSLDEATRTPWGDANATWRLRLADGRDLVGRRFASGHAADPQRVAATMTLAAESGIPVPDARLITIDGTPWLVTNRVDGAVGAAWLDAPARARTLAAAMAGLRRRLLEIGPSGAAGLAPPQGLDRPPPGSATAKALEAAESVLSERRLEGVFVHGDFAPINVIVDTEGGIRALLDFEHAHLGDPLEDVAWWCWVVRHHHPDAWHAAWPTFCAAASVDSVDDGSTIHALVIRTLARRAGAARDAQARDRWLGHLSEAAAWRL